MDKFSICIVGCGDFARCFVPLFKAHPYISKVFVCDKIAERALEYQKMFGVERIDSFEEAVASPNVDAIAVFVQRHLHGEVVVRALEAGKHVYSAVPMASSVEDCGRIIEAVKKTGKVYMMGETCVYYPCSMYCKKALESGKLGKFVYGEAQYHHDVSHFPESYWQNDPELLAVPPFYYATHSTSMLLNAIGDHVVKVSAVGYRDTEEDGLYGAGKNPWDNPFSDEFSLMQLSGGGTIRVNECRRIGYKAPSSYVSGFYGTKGSYQFSNAQHIVTTLTPKGVALEDVSDQVNPVTMTEARDRGEENFKEQVANHVWQWTDMSPQQAHLLEERPHLTEEFLSLPSGHMNSHRFLVDDFCTAVRNNTLPAVNAWVAARFTIPGLIAHESACRGGELLDVPDFGQG